MPETNTEYSQIYVGDLEPEIDEKILYAHALKVFPGVEIFSIRVVRDWTTYQSLKYAYVNLTKRDDAVKFISMLNHTIIVKNQLRVSWKLPKESRGSPDANLFVNKLNKSTTITRIDELFEKYGPITSSKLVAYADSLKAYVQLDAAEKAQNAIKELNGKQVDGNVLTVALFQKRADRQQKYTNLYVKNFPEGTTLESLAEVFSKHGTVTSTYIGLDAAGAPKVKVNEDGTRTLYGFVNYATHEEAVKAKDALNGMIYPGTTEYTIEVTRAMKKADRHRALVEENKNMCLYIGTIPKETTKEELQGLFAKNGKVTFLNYPEKQDPKGYRFAYCYFETRDEAERARQNLSGYTLMGTPIRVEFYKTKAQLQAEMELRKRQPPMQMAGNNYFYPYGQAQNYSQSNYNARKKMNKPRNPRDNRRGYPAQNAAVPQMAAAIPAPAVAAAAATAIRAGPATVKIEPIAENELEAMADEDKHEAFGERIYNYMSEAHPESYAGKITGMVLETFKGNFAHLNAIIADGSIINKINEAIAVYKDHESKN